MAEVVVGVVDAVVVGVSVAGRDDVVVDVGSVVVVAGSGGAVVVVGGEDVVVVVGL